MPGPSTPLLTTLPGPGSRLAKRLTPDGSTAVTIRKHNIGSPHAGHNSPGLEQKPHGRRGPGAHGAATLLTLLTAKVGPGSAAAGALRRLDLPALEAKAREAFGSQDAVDAAVDALPKRGAGQNLKQEDVPAAAVPKAKPGRRLAPASDDARDKLRRLMAQVEPDAPEVDSSQAPGEAPPAAHWDDDISAPDPAVLEGVVGDILEKWPLSHFADETVDHEREIYSDIYNPTGEVKPASITQEEYQEQLKSRGYSDGYWHHRNVGALEDVDRNNMTRFYLNLKPDHAAAVADDLEDRLKAAGIKHYQYKMPANLEKFNRSDAGVLYVRGDQFAEVSRIVQELVKEHPDALSPEVPRLTKQIAPGVATAEEPNQTAFRDGLGSWDSVSFGSGQAKLLASALQEAAQDDPEMSREQVMDKVRASYKAWIKADPDRPWLNGVDDEGKAAGQASKDEAARQREAEEQARRERLEVIGQHGKEQAPADIRQDLMDMEGDVDFESIVNRMYRKRLERDLPKFWESNQLTREEARHMLIALGEDAQDAFERAYAGT